MNNAQNVSKMLNHFFFLPARSAGALLASTTKKQTADLHDTATQIVSAEIDVDIPKLALDVDHHARFQGPLIIWTSAMCAAATRFRHPFTISKSTLFDQTTWSWGSFLARKYTFPKKTAILTSVHSFGIDRIRRKHAIQRLTHYLKIYHLKKWVSAEYCDKEHLITWHHMNADSVQLTQSKRVARGRAEAPAVISKSFCFRKSCRFFQNATFSTCAA